MFIDLTNSSADEVAANLIGKFLVRRVGGKTRAYMIVETEAYVGPHDKASHSYGGRRTKRNDVMYGPPGHWYVYFTYGMHHMLNLVTGPAGYPSAVLIRGVIEIPYANVLKNISIRSGASRRKRKVNLIGPVPLEKSRPKVTEALLSAGRSLTGPGRVTKALRIDKRLNGKPVGRSSGLWIEDRPADAKAFAGKGFKIIRTPRIGIGYAEEWKDKPLRFVIKPGFILTTAKR